MIEMTAQLKARYYKSDGKAGKEYALPVDPFNGVVHEESIYHAIKAYRASQRQGTAAAKSRAQVRGGGRKPWKQKGTGRARAGTIRSPIWRGGGIVFPPQPRDYRQKLPKKLAGLAHRSALNARAAEDRIVVLESFAVERPRTSEIVKLTRQLGLGDEKVLILTAGLQPAVYLSARNVPNLMVKIYGTESTYDLLWADSLLIEEKALSGVSAPVEAAEASDA